VILPQRSLQGPRSGIIGSGVPPRQPVLASRSLDDTVKLWGRCHRRRCSTRFPKDSRKSFVEVAFSPNGGRYLAAGERTTPCNYGT